MSECGDPVQTETGLRGLAAFPSSSSQVPGKYLCFLLTKVSEKNVVDPDYLVVALSRIGDFLIEKEVREVTILVYDPNSDKLNLASSLSGAGDNSTPTQQILSEHCPSRELG